jgi:hypothetical protein
VEALDLPVGLGTVGPGPLVSDAELGAGVAPRMGPVGRAVVGQDPLGHGHRRWECETCGRRLIDEDCVRPELGNDYGIWAPNSGC